MTGKQELPHQPAAVRPGVHHVGLHENRSLSADFQVSQLHSPYRWYSYHAAAGPHAREVEISAQASGRRRVICFRCSPMAAGRLPAGYCHSDLAGAG
ncbi:hypothetical protein [Nocardia sp. NPDC004860]|uniref:hypothetical protein n=1 Tax=Nocardia sp. NPDC004860 TaxID=3154557 RepID=UPI0033B494CD